MDNSRTSPRKAGRGIDSTKVTAELPIPAPGDILEIEIPRYNLTVLIQRSAEETQEQKRARYAVVAPIAPDRRLHVARVGVGALKAKRLSITACTQALAPEKSISSGARVDVSLETVTCLGCLKLLKEEGIELNGESE